MSFFIVLFFLVQVLVAADPQTADLGSETLRGGLLTKQRTLYTWGDRLRVWSVDRLTSTITPAVGPFGEGACLTDLDSDGVEEFITVSGVGLGKLVSMHPPEWRAEVIDTEVEMHDCLQATLFGRKGVLMIHRGAQVRFYERPQSPGDKWKSRDIYSIYTPSYQTGLALHDVDRDGRTDILCGNYWIQSPVAFDLSWRIFAINLHYKDPDSAMFRIVLPGSGTMAASQGHTSPGLVSLFKQPTDPKQTWTEQRLADMVRPHGLAVWNGLLVAGEDNGAESRLVRFQDSRTEELGRGHDVLTILPLNRSTLITVGRHQVVRWTQPRRR